MDVVIHTLTGYMLSRAGLNRLSPRASAILMISAAAPDLDLVTMAGGDLLALEYQRGITHSLLAIPLLALVPLLMRFHRDRSGALRASLLGAIGVASHLLADMAGTYGERLLYPFSGRWFHLDLVPSTDVVICGILVIATGWLALSQLVSREIGAGPSGGRAAALLTLAAVLMWTGGRWILHERAVSILESRLYSHELPLRVAAFPQYANPFLWRGIVETGDAYHSFELDLAMERFDPGRGQVMFKQAESPEIRAAETARPIRALLGFARYPYWTTAPWEESEGALQVQVIDLAFALPGQDRFTATAILGDRGNVLESQFRY